MPEVSDDQALIIAKILQDPLVNSSSCTDNCGCNEACGCKKDTCCESKCGCDGKAASAQILFERPDFREAISKWKPEDIKTIDEFKNLADLLRKHIGEN